MIVKNEMANLERCLGAVAPHVAAWVIGDTGSTDGTPEFIARFFAERGIPGESHRFPFEDFAQARNAALEYARRSALDFDYLLFADADMELVVDDPGFAAGLTARDYRVLQQAGVSYWNLRLLRRDTPARYRGVTHEYLQVEGESRSTLAGIRFIDHASGANRVDKYERDARLLTRALAAETDPELLTRYNFYLANTLRDAGRKAEAVPYYAARARLGGWRQEVFMSLLHKARIEDELGQPIEQVLAGFEAATAACPERVEALHAAALCCRLRGLHQRAYEFAARGIERPRPDAGLFVHDWIYRHGLLEEYFHAAYETGRLAEAVAACDLLLAPGRLPEGERARVEQNRALAVAKRDAARQRIADGLAALDGAHGRLLAESAALPMGDADDLTAAMLERYLEADAEFRRALRERFAAREPGARLTAALRRAEG